MDMRKVFCFLTICFSMVQHVSAQQYGSFKDSRDGRVYKTVKIGSQLWMAENLNVDRFQNGDLLFHAKTNEEWVEASKNKIPAYCYFENNERNSQRFGKLYNWWAIIDLRTLAPEGFKMPNEIEWRTLVDYCGGYLIAGTKIKSTVGWREGCVGTNETGFSAIPGGGRYAEGKFDNINLWGRFWSLSEKDDGSAFCKVLADKPEYKDIIYEIYNFKGCGFSVRCILD